LRDSLWVNLDGAGDLSDEALRAAVAEGSRAAPTSMSGRCRTISPQSFEPPFVPFVAWPADFEERIEGPVLPQFSRAFRRYG